MLLISLIVLTIASTALSIGYFFFGSQVALGFLWMVGPTTVAVAVMWYDSRKSKGK